VLLKDLLERVEVAPEATDVWFECADAASFGNAPPFLRSIPLAKARADVLLALEMNGAPLSPRHGAPVRAIVPGWYGMASAKWVTTVRVDNRPSDGHFMVRGYRYQYPDDPAPAGPVEKVRVKSMITTPLDGARVAPGKVKVAGWAWSGEGRIDRVEFSTDHQKTWQPARLVGEDHEFAWRRWEGTVTLAAGRSVTVAVAASDTSGAVQPLEARANAGGYANNSIHRVSFHARG